MLDSLSGARQSLTGQRGRAVLVHFFATWCDSCRREMPSLKRLTGQLGGWRLTVLAIDTGEPDARVRRFFEKQPVNFPVLLDRDRAVSKSWQVALLPTTFLLDSQLRPRFVVEGDFDWDSPAARKAIGGMLGAGHDRAPARSPSQVLIAKLISEESE